MNIISAAYLISLSIAMLSPKVSGFNCAGSVTVENEGLLNYLATIKFLAPLPLNQSQWNMEIQMDSEFTFLGGWQVWVNNKPEEGKTTIKSRDTNITLGVGDEVSFRIRIQWFKDEPRPNIISMIWEGNEICLPGGISVETSLAAIRRRRTSTRDRSRYPMRRPVN